MMWSLRFRRGIGCSARSFKFIPFVLFVVFLLCARGLSANVNVQLANLKQDMELATRQLVGLRSEVELLRRENAQLRVSVEQLTRKQNSATGSSQGLSQQVDTRLQALERRASHAEKTQVEVQKNLDGKLKGLIEEMNRAIAQVNKSGVSVSSAHTQTFSTDHPKTGFVHEVEKGETISSIAKKYSSTIKWIIDANQIVDPQKVFVGEALFVPQK